MTFLTARCVVACAVFALSAGAGAAAQSPPLAEVARKEQERRKTIPPATKILTNKDLPKVAGAAPPPASSSSEVVPAEAAKSDAAKPAAGRLEADPAATGDPERPKDEAWWRARVTEPRQQLARDEVLLDALQARVNGLSSDFVGRDDPYQRARIGDDRQKAIAEMERVRAEIIHLKKAIEDIEEEARRASVPPGWLR